MVYIKVNGNNLNNGKSDAILKGDILFCEKITPEQLITAKDMQVVIKHPALGIIISKAQSGFFVSNNGNPRKYRISRETLNFAYRIVEIQRSRKRES